MDRWLGKVNIVRRFPPMVDGYHYITVDLYRDIEGDLEDSIWNCVAGSEPAKRNNLSRSANFIVQFKNFEYLSYNDALKALYFIKKYFTELPNWGIVLLENIPGILQKLKGDNVKDPAEYDDLCSKFQREEFVRTFFSNYPCP